MPIITTAQQNMDTDFFIFQNFTGSPEFRVYNFKNDCITIGYSQNKSELFYLNDAKMLNIEIVNRPTGGGIVFHSDKDIIFCAVYPFSLFNNNFRGAYLFVSNIVFNTLISFGIAVYKSGENRETKFSKFCFSAPQNYEIVLHNKKVVGIAQRRAKDKILIQGTINFSMPKKDLFLLCKDNRFSTENASYISDYYKNIDHLKMANVLAVSFNKQIEKVLYR